MKWKLFEAGLTVGVRQLLAVFVLGLVILSSVSLESKNIEHLTEQSDDSALRQRSTHILPETAIAVADLLVAVGLVVTSTRSITSTAYEIRHAARRRNPTNPFGVVERLIGLTGIAAFGCAFLRFTGEHSAVASVESSGVVAAAAPLLRPGLASTGFAFFGAITRAALQSKKLSRN